MKHARSFDLFCQFVPDVALTNMIQVCINFHLNRVIIIITLPDNIGGRARTSSGEMCSAFSIWQRNLALVARFRDTPQPRALNRLLRRCILYPRNL